jgi:hypothetical protein
VVGGSQPVGLINPCLIFIRFLKIFMYLIVCSSKILAVYHMKQAIQIGCLSVLGRGSVEEDCARTSNAQVSIEACSNLLSIHTSSILTGSQCSYMFYPRDEREERALDSAKTLATKIRPWTLYDDFRCV